MSSCTIKRSRSNDGFKSTVFRLPTIDCGLLLAIRKELTPKPLPKEKKIHIRQTVSDDEVLMLRKLRTWYGLSTTNIATLTGIPLTSVIGILAWTTRLHLDPGRTPAVLDHLDKVVVKRSTDEAPYSLIRQAF